MRRLKIPALVAVAVVAGAATAQAQVAGQYQVTVKAGPASFDESSAIKDTWGGGLDARYFVTDNVGLGFYFSTSRPDTDGTFFPTVRLEFADTALIHQVSMEIGTYEFGVAGTFRLPVHDRFALYGTGGVGQWVITQDAQAARTAHSNTRSQDYNDNGLGFMLGGGIDFSFTDNAGFRVGVEDMVYTDYDRDFLNISDPLFEDETLPDPSDTGVPEESDTIHNLRFTVGLNFVPGG